MSDLVKFKRLRAGRRSQVTKLINETKASIDTMATPAEVKSRIEILKTNQKQIMLYDDEIYELVTDEAELEIEMEESDKYLLSIHTQLVKLNEKLDELKVATDTEDIKVPRQTLPTFSGDWSQWTHFWDSFKGIHASTKISTIQKMRILSGQLTDQAKRLTEGISLEARNYNTLVDLLKSSFGKEDVLKASHILELLGVEGPTNQFDSLSEFRSQIECHIRSLHILNITADEIFACILQNKLPTNLGAVIKRANGADWLDLDKFRGKLLEEMNTIQTQNLGDEIGQSKEKKFMATSTFAVSENKFKCKFCESTEHGWSSCLTYNTNQKRVDRARDLKLCLNCLSNNHFRGNCDLSKIKPCFNCGNKHYTKLCLFKKKVVNKVIESSKVNKDTSVRRKIVKQTPTDVHNISAKSKRKTGVLSRIDVPLFRPKGKIKCTAFLDTGSQVSFIRRSLLNKVRYEKIEGEDLLLRVFHHQEKVTHYDSVRVFYGYKGKTYSMDFFVEDDNAMPESAEYADLDRHLCKIRESGIILSSSYNKKDKIDLFVGQDNYYTLVHPGFERRGELILLPTKFGYTLGGRYTQTLDRTHVSPVIVMKVATDSLEDNFKLEEYVGDSTSLPYKTKDDLNALWELDHIGIKENELDEKSILVLKDFEENLKFIEDEGQYEVSLPWKIDPIKLPSNFGLAKGRLRSIQNKFVQDKKFAEQYSKVMEEQEKRGFIERVPCEEINNCKYPQHYLAHHGVKKDSLTSALRVVFDASASLGKGNLSLNDCLYSGPSLVPEMVQVLMRFRLFKYACISDIEKAYLMLKLSEKDKDVTRFLWPENLFDLNSNLITYRFKVVLFGATCSQFLLNATILKHLSTIKNKEIFKRGLYIDNLQFTTNNEKDLLNFYWTAQETFAGAHLYLREWNSNTNLNEQFQLDNVLTKRTEYSKVLGMKWYPSEDILEFREISFSNISTKRGVLSDVAKIFDPLGFLLPVTIRGRLFMQELWRLEIKWDQPLPSDLVPNWENLKNYLLLILNIRIPRVLTVSTDVDIHVFCDASSTAYGAVVYFTFSGENHSEVKAIKCKGTSRFVIAKAKVAPIKRLTIPKLELTAVVLAARLVKYVWSAYDKELSFKGINVWIDSQIVLYWLKSRKCDMMYVRNRVDDISNLLPNAVFRYVPTKDNPSDMLTRGVNFCILNDSLLWREGPTWLCDKKLWPCWSECDFENKECETSVENVVCSPLIVSSGKLVNVCDFSKFSKYDRVIRVVAWIVRFKDKLLNKLRGTSVDSDGYLKLEELRRAERMVVHWVQTENYNVEFECLQNDNNNTGRRVKVKTASSLVNQLGLYIDCQVEKYPILRCRSRLEHANLSVDAKNPILLPRKHHITKLLIEKAHRICAHYGISYVLAFLRQTWWIPRMRQTIKVIIKKCLICKKFQGRPFNLGMGIPELPDYRVKEVAPFQVTGVDYTGALHVKEGDHVIKVYIVLFTCAVTRAVHIELVKDQTTESFLRAFRRFCGRRTYPDLMLSDNAPYFVSAAGFLRDINEDPNIKYLQEKVKCKWHFIPVRAPWFGAIWERCIGILKSGLKKVLGRAMVSFDELLTILVELEAIVNDRPLTYVSGELGESVPLTPSHLLNSRRSKLFPNCVELVECDDPDYVRNQASSQELTKRFSYLSRLINNFWRRWSDEYLTFLRQFQTSSGRNISQWPKIGDVVLIHDDGPRMFWKIGRIIQLFGDKNNCRVAKLRSGRGISIRPLVRLYPLEVNVEDQDGDAQESNPSMSEDLVQVKSRRVPSRRTARMAADLWRSRIVTGQL